MSIEQVATTKPDDRDLVLFQDESREQDDLLPPEDGDTTLFQDDLEEASRPSPSSAKTWKVLVVDDEEQVHSVTRLALKKFSFDEKPLELLTAYSAQEAQTLLQQHHDTAVILLDVVMESDHAGLELVRYVRQNLQNHNIRIILRTGQPGLAPELSIVEGHDINDYKTKTELTQPKLFSALTTAIRSYRDILTVEESRQQIEVLNQKLTALNQDLENKVLARTRELEAKNRQLKQEIAARIEAQRKMESMNRELDKANQKLSFWANFDELTSLSNRRSFDKYLEQLWRQGYREQRCLCIVLCDVDFFKQYNDTYGHLAGDYCLRKVGLAFREIISRPLDLAARFGGEEFVIVLYDTDIRGGEKVAQRLQSKLKELKIEHSCSTVSEYVSISIGVVAMVPSNQVKIETLLSQADTALYEAKAKGRNQIILSNVKDDQRS